MNGDNYMATAPTQIRIDADIKKQATELFSYLGLDMSSAVNLFLHQCVIKGGLPFSIELPKYSQSTLAAFDEAKRISKDPHIKGYSNMNELKKALEE